MAAPHDNAYKHLFSHPQAVRDLLRGFVQEDWVALLDYGSLEKVNGSYVSDDLRDRQDDIVWRIRMQQPDADEPAEWLYVYLLLEFQSSNDPYMALRMLGYVALLYQDLVKSGQVEAGALPAVFPLVLYNGERPWRAEREVQRLIERVPASLAAYRPRLRYFLLDEGRLSEASLDQPDNAVASVVRIERSASPQELADLIGGLARRLQSPDNRELRRALSVWIKRLILPRFTPEGQRAAIGELDDLPEVHHMISERIESWKEQLQKQALLQGRQEGLQVGQAEGLLRLLARRFGALPAGLEARVREASVEQIEQWFDRAVDAAAVTEVFGEHRGRGSKTS